MDSKQYGLRERKAIPANAPPPSPKPKPPTKSGAERARLYRERLKSNGMYKQYLLTKREESQQYRDKLKETASEEKQDKIRQATRERVRKHRLLQKEHGKATSESPKVLTRRQKDKIKETNKDRKRKERENWSEKKWKMHRQKCRERYQQKRQASQNVAAVAPIHESTEAQFSPVACKKAVQRVCSKLPKQSGKRQLVIQEFFKRFRKEEVETDETIKVDKATKGKLAAAISSSKNLKTLAKKFSMNRMYLSRLKSRAKDSQNVLRRPSQKSIARYNELTKFYADVSTSLSEKKKVRSGKPAYVLTKTLDELYEQYIIDPGHSQVSKSFFKKMRPKNVRLAQSEQLNQCLCDICENMVLKIVSIDSYLAPEKKVKSIYRIADLMLCDKGENVLHRLDCVEEKCSDCGKGKLLKCLFAKLSEHLQDTAAWRRWAIVEKKKKLVMKTGTVMGLVMEMAEDANLFPFHLFKAKWQLKEFCNVKSSPPPDSCITVLDFAENYRCTMQDEIQSAHWSYEQATIHPLVSYYRCQECPGVVTHVVAIISDDLRHDSFAVKKFLAAFYRHMDQKNVSFKRHIQWSDGCACQYKSKRPFFDLAEASKDREIERNFFGSRHGKNACDGESAVIKSAATRAVKARRSIIQNALDFFNFCQQHLQKASEGTCSHYLRDFLFISDIDRSMPEEELLAVQGTRQLHSMR